MRKAVAPSEESSGVEPTTLWGQIIEDLMGSKPALTRGRSDDVVGSYMDAHAQEVTADLSQGIE